MRHLSFVTLAMLIGILAGVFAMPFVPWRWPALYYAPTAGAIIGVILGCLTNWIANRGLDR